MACTRRRTPLRLLPWLAGLLALCWAGVVLARGTVAVSDRAPVEDDGTWNLKFEIDYGAVPHVAHVPMVFSFRQTVYHERALTDEGGDKPQLIKKPVTQQPPIELPMDVGFSDAQGKTYRKTKFSVRLSRARDFEAGEYTLDIRTGDGTRLGNTIKITLQGDNPIVDRRAIIFHADTRPKPKPAPAPEPEPEPESEPEVTASDEPVRLFAYDGPEPEKVPPKQGGCGCRLVGTATPPTSAALGLLGLAGLALVVGRRARRPHL